MNKIRQTVEQKLAMNMFPVKTLETQGSIKEINEEERTIKAIGNTYFWIDSDIDMLIPGCALKTIADNGPTSKAIAKIKHQQDHVLRTTNAIGRITVLDERKIDNKDVLYFESIIPRTAKGDEHLGNYQEKVYDNHSIGFRYKILVLADKDGNNKEVAIWNEFYPKALNPEVADERGFFYVVKEIELFEISVVSFGANRLTPYLGSKAKGDDTRLKNELISRIEELETMMKNSSTDKGVKKSHNLEASQLKQIIHELKLEKPKDVSTAKIEQSPKSDTIEDENSPYSLASITKHI